MLEGQHIKLDIVGVGPYFRSLNFHTEGWSWTRTSGETWEVLWSKLPEASKVCRELLNVVALKAAKQTAGARKQYCLAPLCANVLVPVKNLYV